ncbi:MAG TPA: argininosuccinate lyase [Vicinamibacterales bacterium]|jgi:argininosuccinate lyase|nr:argininosuccinate lyase [Vicinamibacterales bacterium]
MDAIFHYMARSPDHPSPDHRTRPLWSGRFAEAPDAAIFAWGASFRFDRRLFEDDITGSLAWAEALEAAGAISRDDARAIRDGLTAILDDARRDPSFLEPGTLGTSGTCGTPDEDVHSFVERKLVERIGDAGRRLHTGRSRNEQVSVDLRLYLRRRIDALQRETAQLVAALADQAEVARDAVIPAYTHLRRAQPVLVAHFFLAHAAAFRRDHARLGAAAAEADAMPLGSGAIAGTNYAIDTKALAARLGFSRVVANSLDASSDRDFVSSFLHAAALTMVHLSRLAEDLILFTGEEFGFFALADAVATGSSLMPQKKNPDPLELVRGKAGRAIGTLTGWLASMKGLPAGYNKDLQEDKEAVFDAEDTLAGSLAATRTVVGGLTLDRARAAGAASGLLLATDVVDYLVARGMPFRTAHELVGAMVRRLLDEQRGFESLTPQEWRGFSDLFEDDVLERVSAAASVAAKRTPQSTAPEAVAQQLADVRGWLRACLST